MYGNIVSSNGEIVMDDSTLEKEIHLEYPVSYFSITAHFPLMLYVNDDPDGIFIPLPYCQPFVIDKIPIWKFKVTKYGLEDREQSFSYYGMY